MYALQDLLFGLGLMASVSALCLCVTTIRCLSLSFTFGLCFFMSLMNE